MITCGNCKGQHDTVAEVKACHVGSGICCPDHSEFYSNCKTDRIERDSARSVQASTTAWFGKGIDRPEEAATDKQLKLLEGLVRTSVIAGLGTLKEEVADHAAWVADLTARGLALQSGSKRIASDSIDRFIKDGVKPTWAYRPPAKGAASTEVPSKDELPAGRYALVVDGEVKFFQVKDKRSGDRIVVSLHGAPGDFEDMWIRRPRQLELFAILLADPAEAALRFSRKFTCCSRCMAPLSLVRSRATGFGETCAGRLGVDYLDRATALRVLDEEGLSLEGLEDLELVSQ